MKLFLLSQTVNSGYDTYSDCVVCAESKEDAVTISPDSSDPCPIELGKEHYYNAWATQKDVTVEYIGEAKEDLQRGVICSSFHAG